MSHVYPVPAVGLQSHERGLHPKGTINCAGYKVLTSVEQYMELLDNSLPGEARERGGGREEVGVQLNVTHTSIMSRRDSR